MRHGRFLYYQVRHTRYAYFSAFCQELYLPTYCGNTYPLTVAASSTLSGAPHALCRPPGAYYTSTTGAYYTLTIGAYYTLTTGAYYTLTIRTRYSLLPPPSTIRRRSQLRMAPRSGTSCGLGVVGSGRISLR